MNNPFIFVLFFIIIFICNGSRSRQDGLCTVFDLFKVKPDNAKYKIGGPFALHAKDCIRLDGNSVQELVAIQWALMHWNLNPANQASKLGFLAGDTCSRPKETLAQTVRLLDSFGFYTAPECSSSRMDASKLLGLLISNDQESTHFLTKFLSHTDLPSAIYGTNTFSILQRAQIRSVVSTVPSIDTFLGLAVSLLKHIDSNLITFIHNQEYINSLGSIRQYLDNADIYIAEFVDVSEIDIINKLQHSPSKVVISLLSSSEMHHLFASSSDRLFNLNILWIDIPTDGFALDIGDQFALLPKKCRLQLVVFQQKQKIIPQFRDYFLHILKNNYQSYSLFASYVQQIFNCSLVGARGFLACSNLNDIEMERLFTQSPRVEAVIKLVYTLAAIGAQIESNYQARRACQHPGSECTQQVMGIVRNLHYRFNSYDPVQFVSMNLSFDEIANNVFLANDINLEGIHLRTDDSGRFVVEQIINHRTGGRLQFVAGNFSAIPKSSCSSYLSVCNKCHQSTITVERGRFFPSIPGRHSLFIVALFNLNSGNVCAPYASVDISLPMAFFYAVQFWRRKSQPFNETTAGNSPSLASLIIDVCPTDAHMHLLLANNNGHCVHLDGTAVIVPPSAIFGLASTMHNDNEPAAAAAVVPLLNYHEIDSPSQSLALVQLLLAIDCDFVTVVVSGRDAASLDGLANFRIVAVDYGICLNQVVDVDRSIDPIVQPVTNAIVIFGTAPGAGVYLRGLASSFGRMARFMVILVGDAHDWKRHYGSRMLRFPGTILSLQARDILSESFRQWMTSSSPKTLSELWFLEHIEREHNCTLTGHTRSNATTKCTGTETVNVDRLGRMTKSGYLLKNVATLLATFSAVLDGHCRSYAGLCDQFIERGRADINDLFVQSRSSIDTVFEVYAQNDQSITVGNWSATSGLQLTGDFVSIGSTCRSSTLCTCQCASFGRVSAASVVHKSTSSSLDHTLVHRLLLALTTVLMLVTFAVFLLFGVKLYSGAVEGNQSLGISLLLSILLLYTCAYLHLLPSTDLMCRLRIVVHPLAHSLCFGLMLVKASQLCNAETVGFVGTDHISYWNYWLLLSFIVAVQLALSTHWIAESSVASRVWVENDRMELVCAWSQMDFLSSQNFFFAIIRVFTVLVSLLLLLTLFVTSLNRNLKRNYQEARWLFAASLCLVGIWICWTSVCTFGSPSRIVIVVEVLVFASVLLCLLFGPKLYILLLYEPTLVETPSSPTFLRRFHLQQLDNSCDLFERDEDDDNETALRSVSPTSNSVSSTSSTNLPPTSPSGHRSAIFQTVMQKKKSEKIHLAKEEKRRRFFRAYF